MSTSLALPRCVVFGASGELGQLVVRCALDCGLNVAAVVRAPCAGLERMNCANLLILQGDIVHDTNFVSNCVGGGGSRDAIIISCLGLRIAGLAVWNRPADSQYLASASLNIARAMQAHGVDKIVLISPVGAGASWDQLPFEMQCFLSITALGHVLPLMGEVEQIFLDKGLDLCIVRPACLTRGPRTRRIQAVGDVMLASNSLSRADVAFWVVGEACKPGKFQQQNVFLGHDSANHQAAAHHELQGQEQEIRDGKA